MKREYWEQLGLERELINLIMAENGRDLQSLRSQAAELSAERDALSAKLEEMIADKERTSKREQNDLSAEQAAFEAALEAVSSEYSKSLAKQAEQYSSKLAAAEDNSSKMLNEALARQKTDLESDFSQQNLIFKVEAMFANAGFCCDLAHEAAVARFIRENGTPEIAGEWLTELRNSEPAAFAPSDKQDGLPYFAVEPPASDENKEQAGGLLSSVLKKLR